ncbi:S-layer homology domain-containing protein [Patescibacteria group bacterium]|nr:S-layer homology domain-containing protein [Patescibacteria group bacterium]MBU1702783.1 S-layer homology domain-containing protein [Patescibacteria group bacterium]MBU1954095.1 S-layer homology domain-containing protein [Patescibacteria group bacterium]
MNKRLPLPSLLLALAIVFLLPQISLASFKDVPESHTYYEAISALENSGLIKGYADGSFQPEKIINKAEFIKLAFNHAGYNPPEKFYKTPFKDVPEGSWFAPYVKLGNELGIIPLNPDLPNFFPRQPINRIDALKIILPLEGIPSPINSYQTELVFQDIEPGSIYEHYAKAAQNSGIFIPEEQPYFFPQKDLTRGEAAELLYRAQIYRQNTEGTYSTMPGSFLDTVYVETGASSDLIDNAKFPILLSIWEKINNDYLYREKIDKDQLIYGAINGIVETLQDQYTVFESPSTSMELQNSLNGTYEGIGIVIDTFEDQYLIISVMKDSPAQEAGLLAGDTIVEVDGKDVGKYTITKLLNAIKGPSGSTVQLKIKRDNKTMSFKITRKAISMDTVLLEGGIEIPKNIGYIAIYQFTNSTPAEFKKLLDETMSDGPNGLILDLRDNPGGYVSSAYEVLDSLVPQGETLVKTNFKGNIISEPSNGPSETGEINIPMVVLVNEYTASAAEIVAGALQDHKIATIVGEPTYGKGTMQEVDVYTDGSLFKMSIAEWFTPNNHKVDQLGITPDIIVIKTKDDVLGKTDSILQRAITELQKKF